MTWWKPATPCAPHGLVDCAPSWNRRPALIANRASYRLKATSMTDLLERLRS
ncbi:hypothetical protein [Candidatus Amarolinea dominans]|uniref:hypothetical protein n=1 Tax=Candidatus Amarolinea dominans TaxID=3140696 RepID=UPI0031CCD916